VILIFINIYLDWVLKKIKNLFSNDQFSTQCKHVEQVSNRLAPRVIFCGIQGFCDIQVKNQLQTLLTSHLFVILAQH